MDWKELTSHQKICQVQLMPDTPLGYVYELVGKLPSPWKDTGCKFTWSIADNCLLKIHAQKQPHRKG